MGPLITPASDSVAMMSWGSRCAAQSPMILSSSSWLGAACASGTAVANLHPAVLEAHPGVAAAHVAGVADPEWGQRLCAAVVPADPASPVGENALRAHIRDALGAAAVPKTWLALDALPLLSTGKTDRQALAARFTAG